MDDETLGKLLAAVWVAGFEASGEGWNAEYPFAQHGRKIADDPDLQRIRDEDIIRLIAGTPS